MSTLIPPKKTRRQRFIESAWYVLKKSVVWASVALVVISILTLFLAVLYGWDWTKLGAHRTNGEYVPAKTLWDWLDLLIVPLILAGGGLLIRETIQRVDRERELDRQREQALQNYYDKMTELLLEKGLAKAEPKPDKEVKAVARTRTLTTLGQLDPERKRQVLQFLREAGLIWGRGRKRAGELTRVINLAGADLRGVNLVGENLTDTHLQRVDLTGADLRSTVLRGIDLTEAVLANARMEKATLEDAHLNSTDLSGADLRDAYLTGADLRTADLRRATLKRAILAFTQLHGAKLNRADLRGASLYAAKGLSKNDLAETKFSRKAIMPSSREFDPKKPLEEQLWTRDERPECI